MTPTEMKEARRELGLSQSDLADLLGLEGDNRDRTVRMWEAGDRAIPASAARLLRLAAASKAEPALRLRAGLKRVGITL